MISFGKEIKTFLEEMISEASQKVRRQVERKVNQFLRKAYFSFLQQAFFFFAIILLVGAGIIFLNRYLSLDLVLALVAVVMIYLGMLFGMLKHKR